MAVIYLVLVLHVVLVLVLRCTTAGEWGNGNGEWEMDRAQGKVNRKKIRAAMGSGIGA